MLILAIETSTRRGGVALLREGSVLGEIGMDAQLNHSAGLVVAIEDLLLKCGKEREEIDGIGVDVGPGSFTGVRVGIAAAKGLARGLSVPVSGVTSLGALVSMDSSGHRYLFPLVDARSGLFYGALFEKDNGRWRRLAEIRLWGPGEIPGSVPEGTFFFGPGLSARRDEIVKEMDEGGILDSEARFPSASAIARVAARDIIAGTPSAPTPIYLKSYIRKRKAKGGAGTRT